MDDLQKQIIRRLAVENGSLRANVIELDVRLAQALQTIAALEQEKEAKPDGDTEC